MTMFNKDQIFQLLESRDGEALRALWQGRGAVDIAALLDSVEDGARQAAVFRTLPKDLAADVFSYLPGPTQATLARSFADGELQQIFDALHLDDAADFLEELPANLVTRILRSASPQRRMAVNALLRYPADSAGSVMTPEFVSLRPGDTVRQALDTIRRTGIHKETVYTCYVLEHRQLLGVVSAKDLLTAAEDAAVADLMVTDVVSVGTLTDREEAARLLAKYDLLALPVLDGEERMVGIVTVDDAMDVLTEAAAEDLSIMAAVTPDEKPYFAASAWEHARHRVVWLLILMLSAGDGGGQHRLYHHPVRGRHLRRAPAGGLSTHADGHRRKLRLPERHAGDPGAGSGRDPPPGRAAGDPQGAGGSRHRQRRPSRGQRPADLPSVP